MPYPPDKHVKCDRCSKDIKVEEGRGSVLVYTNNERLLTARDFCASCTMKILLPGMLPPGDKPTALIQAARPRKKSSDLDYNPTAEQDIP